MRETKLSVICIIFALLFFCGCKNNIEDRLKKLETESNAYRVSQMNVETRVVELEKFLNIRYKVWSNILEMEFGHYEPIVICPNCKKER